jgi:hypothetical protein
MMESTTKMKRKSRLMNKHKMKMKKTMLKSNKRKNNN